MLEPNPAVIGRKAGYTLDRSSVHRRAVLYRITICSVLLDEGARSKINFCQASQATFVTREALIYNIVLNNPFFIQAFEYPLLISISMHHRYPCVLLL
ncbi:hypothetical protein MHYP_G00077840 [Metynnis hypsauchen]